MNNEVMIAARESLWNFIRELELPFVDDPKFRLLVGPKLGHPAEGLGNWVVASSHDKEDIIKIAKSLASTLPEGCNLYVQLINPAL